MNITQTPLLIIPLGSEAHHLAGQFAAQQATPQKGKRVYLNTLAVYAVHSYLKWLQVETNLSQGDSWQPSLQAAFDATDLIIPGVGSLECRPVLPGETKFSLPPVTEDRIGYVAVQLSESLDSVQLMGFAKVVHASELAIADLQPIDTLLDYIPDVVPASTTSKRLVNLSHWLENNFESPWLTPEALFSTQAASPAFSIRSNERSNDADNPTGNISRGKLINLGIQLAGHPFALIVTITPAASNEEISVRLRVYPTGRQIHLPENLQLIVLDESGATCLMAESRSADNWIQLEFSGQPGERFSVKVAWGDGSITENFVM